MIFCRTLLPIRRMQTSLGRLCLSSGRMQSPRGSNCGWGFSSYYTVRYLGIRLVATIDLLLLHPFPTVYRSCLPYDLSVPCVICCDRIGVELPHVHTLPWGLKCFVA